MLATVKVCASCLGNSDGCTYKGRSAEPCTANGETPEESLIIRDDGSATDEDITTFTLVSVDGSAELSIKLPTAFVDDFREHLTGEGFRVPQGAARSALVEIIVATAENPAAWTAVGGTVVAFLRRHRGKVHRFEAEGRSVSIEGYSAREAERLATELAKAGRKRHDDPGPGGMTLGRR